MSYKSYMCQERGERFSQTMHLQWHQKIHTGESLCRTQSDNRGKPSRGKVASHNAARVRMLTQQSCVKFKVGTKKIHRLVIVVTKKSCIRVHPFFIHSLLSIRKLLQTLSPTDVRNVGSTQPGLSSSWALESPHSETL